jgi:hypothetical protein
MLTDGGVVLVAVTQSMPAFRANFKSSFHSFVASPALKMKSGRHVRNVFKSFKLFFLEREIWEVLIHKSLK